MTITRVQATDAIEHTLSGVPEGLTSIELANMAGRQMMQSRQWRWSATDERQLDFVAAMSFTSGSEEPQAGDQLLGQTSAATGTVSDLRLESGTWAGGDAAGVIYFHTTTGTFQAAELVDIVGGTADVLTSSGAAATVNYVVLPRNLTGIIDLDTVPDQANHFTLTSPGQLLRLRAVTANSSGPPFWGVVAWTRDPEGLRPWPRIDIFPPPTGIQEDALNCYVRVSWLDFQADTDGGADTDEAVIPPWLDDLYLRFCAVVARGYEDDLESPNRTDEYLEVLQAGAVWRAAVLTDSKMQPILNPPSNGMFGPRQTAWSNVGAVTGP